MKQRGRPTIEQVRERDNKPSIDFFTCDGVDFVKVPANTWMNVVSALYFYSDQESLDKKKRVFDDNGLTARVASNLIKRDLLARKEQ